MVNTDGSIIGGHQRVRSLQALKEKEVDVYVPDRTIEPKDAQELAVRLNKNVGDWDFDALANFFDSDDLLNWGFSDSEFSVDTDVAPKDKEETEKCPTCGKNMKVQSSNDSEGV